MLSCEVSHAPMTRKPGSIGHVVVNYTHTADAFSVGIKCRHCTYIHTLVAYIQNCIVFFSTGNRDDECDVPVEDVLSEGV